MIAEHPYRFLALGTLTGALVGFAVCRFALPDRVTVKTQTEKVEVESSEQRKQIESLRAELVEAKSHTHTDTIVITRTDGTTIRREVTDTKTDTTKHTTEATKTAEVKTEAKATSEKTVSLKETTRERPNWRVGPMVGFDLRTGAVSYGGMVERRILGPFSVGAFGLSNGTAGVSLSLEF